MVPGGWPIYLAAAVFGYVLGTVPVGRVIAAFAGIRGLTARGRGSVGAIDLWRVGAKDLAVLVLVLDIAKIAAAFLGGAIFISIPFMIAAMDGSFQEGVTEADMQAVANQRIVECGVIAGAAAFVGHCYPFWRWFERRRGASPSSRSDAN